MTLTKEQILDAAQRFLDSMLPAEKQLLLDTVFELIDPGDAQPPTFRNLRIVRKKSYKRGNLVSISAVAQEKKAA